MSRISIKTKEDLPQELWPLWERMQCYGAFENQAGVMAHRAPIFKNMWALLTELAEEGVLPKRYLELCLVTVSLLNKCTYCVSHHAPKLAVQGISEAGAARLLDYQDPSRARRGRQAGGRVRHRRHQQLEPHARRDVRAAQAALHRGADRRDDLAHGAVRRLQPLQRHPAARHRAGRRRPRGVGRNSEAYCAVPRQIGAIRADAYCALRWLRIGAMMKEGRPMTAATTPASREEETAILDARRQVAGAGRAAARARARARRHLPRRDGGADEGAGPVRRHHRHGLRRARPLRHHLRPHRAGGVGGVDVARRHLQLAPDHGGLRRARRHRGAEARISAALRDRRAARRPGADRARLRHRPAGDPHPRRARRQRRLSRQRHQDLDLQRHPRPGVRAARQDRPRAPSRATRA